MVKLELLCAAVVCCPLVAGVAAGVLGRRLGRAFAASVTILATGLSFALSIVLLEQILHGATVSIDRTWYLWGTAGGMSIQIGCLLDTLSVGMAVTVLAVSFLVHVYSVGYMHDDPGFSRFFCYISLFTFAMLMLVVANNFLQLFFGWEGVGLMSYLLIGFWYRKESAIVANLKAFLVNRVGDLGLLLGIATIAYYFHSLDYAAVFSKVAAFAEFQHHMVYFSDWKLPVLTLIAGSLFIGAMGKSAQIPLHIWLPDSMEGPTPISALIHAATMVTAGIFMVARMSPLFEQAESVLNLILIIGAVTALLMGLVGVVQNDIKRIVAYSTLSQLGYMVVGLGASAYAISIFHLMTHAFFKALLFLGAGSVILALHHEQNIWKMGGLKRFLPITHAVMLLGSLSLVGIPPFSGFFSKELLIDAVGISQLPAAPFAHWALVISVFITALYSFRLLFVVFYGAPRTPHHAHAVMESPPVVYVPLLCLTVPTLVLGIALVHGVLTERFAPAIVTLPQHNVMDILHEHFEWGGHMLAHSVFTVPFWLAILGIVTAWLAYVRFPQLPAYCAKKASWGFVVLKQKFGFDALNEWVILPTVRGLSNVLWRVVDSFVIDNLLVNGAAHMVARCAVVVRKCQTGYLYHYAFIMISGLLVLLVWMI